MKGDYCRYIAENVDGEKKNTLKKIDYKNPIKFGLVLNISVFYYEVVGNKDEACKLAEDILSKSKETINGADEEEDEVKDAMSIVDLLEENLGMWKVENDE